MRRVEAELVRRLWQPAEGAGEETDPLVVVAAGGREAELHAVGRERSRGEGRQVRLDCAGHCRGVDRVEDGVANPVGISALRLAPAPAARGEPPERLRAIVDLVGGAAE